MQVLAGNESDQREFRKKKGSHLGRDLSGLLTHTDRLKPNAKNSTESRVARRI